MPQWLSPIVLGSICVGLGMFLIGAALLRRGFSDAGVTLALIGLGLIAFAALL